MKRPNEKKIKQGFRVFASERKEAEWWFRNRIAHGRQLLASVKAGEAAVLTKEKLLERIAASKERHRLQS